MKSTAFRVTKLVGALAVVSVAAACSTWDGMTHNQQATGVGAASGAVGGAVVGGPVGAVVGGVGGAVVGHEAAKNEYGSGVNKTAAADNTTSTRRTSNSPSYKTDGNESASASTSGTVDTSKGAPYGGGTASNAAVATGSQQNSRDNSANASRSLSAESTSDSMIRSAQQALNDRGYNAGPVDGLMGPKTEAALRKFQSSSGLPSTGRLDSATVAALDLSASDKSASN